MSPAKRIQSPVPSEVLPDESGVVLAGSRARDSERPELFSDEIEVLATDRVITEQTDALTARMFGALVLMGLVIMITEALR
jgi:hypothetical protein